MASDYQTRLFQPEECFTHRCRAHAEPGSELLIALPLAGVNVRPAIASRTES
jgi:hypothetical protein